MEGDPGQLLVSGRDSPLPFRASPGRRSYGQRRRMRDLRGHPLCGALVVPSVGRRGADDEGSQGLLVGGRCFDDVEEGIQPGSF